MKLITKLYDGYEVQFSINVQSRASKETEGQESPLITPYKSKSGSMSLIFNPSAAVIIRSRDINNKASCYVPMSMVYQVAGMFTAMYKMISNSKMYNKADGQLYLDKKIALQCMQRISLFRNYLSVMPTIINRKDGSQERGIIVLADQTTIGNMTIDEVSSISSILEHLDITSYALLAGIVDSIEGNNARLDTVFNKLDNIELLIRELSKSKISESRFDWKPADGGLL